MHRRCGHFSIETERILVPGAPVMLTVPIRRCALAERMLIVIAQTERGRAVMQKLTIDAGGRPGAEAANAAGEAAQEASEEKAVIRAAFGPDLEAIHGQECTVERCQVSCSPSFKMLLAQFGYEEEADAETGAGCVETEVSDFAC